MTIAAPALLPPLTELSDARRRLFETAITLFGDKGYHAVSVRDLANEMNLQPGALYAHVPSKQHLLFELMRIGHEVHRDALKAALLDSGREPAEQVTALVRAHVLAHLTYPSLARVTNREARALTDEHMADTLAIRAESERMFVDVIERGIRLGAFHIEDPRLAMTAIGAMGIRAAEWWKPEDAAPAEHIADTYAVFAVRLLT